MSAMWQVILSCIIPNVGGVAGGFITKKNIPHWYEKLNKPKFRPPNWLFPPVWTFLYTAMGYASYLIYRDGGGLEGAAQLPLTLYASQLVLNWLWTPIFFGAHQLKMAFFEILLLAANIIACIYTFMPINELAAYLMVPYLAWVSFATYLTFRVWRDNPAKKSSD